MSATKALLARMEYERTGDPEALLADVNFLAAILPEPTPKLCALCPNLRTDEWLCAECRAKQPPEPVAFCADVEDNA